MSKFTFIDFLTEIMVDVDPNDPAGSVAKTKQALGNPDKASQSALASNKEQGNEITRSKNDPNKAKKLRINQMKQRLIADEKRLTDDEQRQAQQAGA